MFYQVRSAFDAEGFGQTAETLVTYIFRERDGKWEHRELDAAEFRRFAGGLSIEGFIATNPDAAFQPAAAK